MDLITFLIVLVIGGLVWYLVEHYVPMPDPVKLVLRVVLVLVLACMVLALFGIIDLPFSVGARAPR
jgi:hypothetical protein